MKRFAVLLLALSLTLGILPAGAVNLSFRDVDSKDYYAQAVDWAVKKEITTGTSSTTFSPNDTCTRGQIITFLWRAAGSPDMSDQPLRSTDVKRGSYYDMAVRWAETLGLFEGKTFSPNTPCTRAMAVEFIWGMEGEPEVKSSVSFSDVPASGNLAFAVAWAVQEGVTTGTSATAFSPNETCTRGQIVTFLWRALCSPLFYEKGEIVTDPKQLTGTYANSRWIIKVQYNGRDIAFEFHLAAVPDGPAGVHGGLLLFPNADNGTLEAKWNGIKITFFKDYAIVKMPPDYSVMEGRYEKINNIGLN